MSRPALSALFLFFLTSLVHAPAFGASAERAAYVMGTLLRVRAEAADETSAGSACEAVLAEVRRQDRLLSTYKPESEISQVNAAAGRRAIQVSSDTYRAVQEALRYARITGGAFDPTWSGRPADFRRLLIDPAARSIRLDAAGMKIDLGGIGKGFALDRAGERAIADARPDRLWMDFGGQLVFWSRAGCFAEEKILVEPPALGEAPLSVTLVRNASVSTAANTQQPGHILDPKTGRRLWDRLSVTVVAPSATEADAWDTALFVLGESRGLALLRDHPAIEAIFVRDLDGKRSVSRSAPSTNTAAAACVVE